MARISTAVRARVEAFDAAGRAPIAGIDVGERYLDLAVIVSPRAPRLEFARIDLRPLARDPIGRLGRAIATAIPGIGPEAVVLVDSPHSPREGSRPRRAIDSELRRIVRAIVRRRRAGARGALPMFPTPGRDYFERCVADPRCAPHLAAFARETLGIGSVAMRRSAPTRGGGWTFTRFMLSGFAAFRALERLRARTFESYPHLAFTLHKTADEPLPSKSERRAALCARIGIVGRLAHEAGIREMPEIATLDQADAAVLAITAAQGAKWRGLFRVSAPQEGAFLLAVARRDRAAAAECASAGNRRDSA